MLEKKISVRFAAAYGAWLVAAGVYAVSWATHLIFLGIFGIIVTAVAATITVCSQLHECADEIRNAMTVVRSLERDGTVRPLN